MTHLTRTSPEADGLDPAAVARLVANFDALDEIHGFVLLRHGNVVAEGHWAPHTPVRPHLLFSVSKAFTSTAVGFAVEEGLLGLDDLVLDHLREEAPAEPSPHLAAMRVRHLLTMTTGHGVSSMEAVDTTTIGLTGSDWVRQVLAQEVPHEPGTTFVYDTGATYLLGVIVQRLARQRLVDYLEPRLLGPLGITGATWEQDPDGFDVAGFGLSVTTEDLARFGQLYLQGGVWEGRRLLPESWVEAATSVQADTSGHGLLEWRQGYGYQFWRSRFGAYRADGAFGQYSIVWPEHDVVLAVTSGIQDLQSVQDAVWDALLPSLDPDAAATLPDGGVPSSAVAPPSSGAMWDLALSTPAGSPTSPVETEVLGVTYVFEPNTGGLESLRLDRDGDELVLTHVRGAGQVLRFAHGRWEHDAEPSAARLAGAFAWDGTTLVVRTLGLGTPFSWTYTLRFDGDVMEVSLDQNVAFGDPHLFDARGTAVRA